MRKLTTQRIIRLYFTAFAVSSVVFVLVNMFSAGELFENIIGSPDYFMDFFNSIRDAGSKDVYAKGVIYPPLGNMVFYFFSKFINPDYVKTDFADRKVLRTDYNSLFVYLLFSFFVLVLICYLISKYTVSQGFENKSTALPLVIAVSFPILYCFQRGNIALLSFGLSLFFVMYRNSEKKWLKELSFVLLAVAAGLKIYPALFGVLLLVDKKYKDAARLVVYGILAFVLPFFFYDGIESICQLIQNLGAFSTLSDNIVSLGFVSIDFFAFYLEMFFSFDYELVYSVLFVVTYGSAVFVLFMSDEEWEKYWAIAFMIMNYTSLARTYILVMSIIPFVYWLFKKEKRKADLFYFVCFMLIMLIITPVYFNHLDSILAVVNNLTGIGIEESGSQFIIKLNKLFAPFVLSGMTVFMFFDNLTICIKKLKKRKLNSLKVSV